MRESLQIRCIMHVPFEGPGVISEWSAKRGHAFAVTRLYAKDPLPDPAGTDILVLMGGPMNVYDYHVHSWLQEEIEWADAFIQTGNPVLGICLGAQVIASALGAEVIPGKHREIGWHSVQFLPATGDFRIWKDLPSTRKVFHWHGDTFPIPRGATRIAESQAYPNQGFIYRDHVFALQFHLEVTPGSVMELVENCRDEITDGPFVQSEKEILDEARFYEPNRELMFQLLDHLESLAT